MARTSKQSGDGGAASKKKSKASSKEAKEIKAKLLKKISPHKKQKASPKKKKTTKKSSKMTKATIGDELAQMLELQMPRDGGGMVEPSTSNRPMATMASVTECDEIEGSARGSGEEEAIDRDLSWLIEASMIDGGGIGSTMENENLELENGEEEDEPCKHIGELPPNHSANHANVSPSESLSAAPKKKVDKYYQKQNDLLERFRTDNEQIQVFQRNRQRQISSNSTDLEAAAPLLLPTAKETEEVATARSVAAAIPDSAGSPKMTLVKELSVPRKRQNGNANGGAVNSGPSEAAARRLAIATLIINVSLMMAKAVAAYLSGSLSIISSLVDSAVDITSGLVIWVTARAIKKRDPYLYPRGRTRLEPLALVIVSVVMGVASVQLIVQSIESIVRNSIDPTIDYVTLGIMIGTICIKLALVIICRSYKNSPSISVLAQDHRNDCVSNTFAILFAWTASRFWLYLDPIGAILVSIYIAVTWYITGREHLAMLSGKTAEPDFINRIIKVCIDHDKRIDFIDTVYVYHFGTRFLVEVHVVMDADMSLRVAHDISESLQINIESLPEVERAFVHCDYEYEHQPTDEHKVV